MNALNTVLMTVASNIHIVFFTVIALLTLSMMIEGYVAILSARAHAPARKIRISNSRSGDIIEIESSNIEIRELQSILLKRSGNSAAEQMKIANV